MFFIWRRSDEVDMVAGSGEAASPLGYGEMEDSRKKTAAGAGGSPHLRRKGPLETQAGPGAARPAPTPLWGSSLPLGPRRLWPSLNPILVTQSIFQFLKHAQLLPAWGPGSVRQGGTVCSGGTTGWGQHSVACPSRLPCSGGQGLLHLSFLLKEVGFVP